MILAWSGLAALRVGVGIAREARAVAYQQVIIASMIEFLATVLAGVLLATVVWHAVRITRPGWIEPARRNTPRVTRHRPGGRWSQRQTRP